ncbi:MAG: glycosyltransferase involved in cell wall biosynthesis [Acidimicrobiales bacterium]
MNIGIVTPVSTSGVVGGAERLWRALAARLVDRGHDVELVAMPVAEGSLGEILDGYQLFHDLDVTRFDTVITGKYPAWMIRHHRHIVYLLHPLRGLYDTYPAHLPTLEQTAEGSGLMSRLDTCADASALMSLARRINDELGPDHVLCRLPGALTREVVRRLDRFAFAPDRVVRFGAISNEVANRVDYLPTDRPVLVAHPETDLPLDDSPPSPQATFLVVSRLDRPKRIDLVIEAFTDYVHDPYARLVVVGEGSDHQRLVGLAEADNRISFVGAIDDPELARWYAVATAVVFTPLAEDFGYVSLEAMRAGTPVIATSDSGGAAELIEHGVDGLVQEPNARDLAWGMRHLSASTFGRWQMGLNARRTAARVSWDTLLDEIDDLERTDPRPHVLVLSTYPVAPAIGGGQRRILELDRSLTERADVTVLVLSSRTDIDRRRHLAPGLVQIEIARSADQLEAEEAIYQVMKMPVDDLTAGQLARATPAFADELRRQLANTDLVVLSQPFLAQTLPSDLDIPVVHDSQNAEFKMKRDLLPDTAGGRWLLEQGIAAETVATERASLLIACTEADLLDIATLDPKRTIDGVVVANGVDTAAMPARTLADIGRARAEVLALAGADPDDHRPVAVFIGSWHPPNIEAGRLILELAASRHDWLFVMAGSHTSEFAADPHPSNVHLIAIFSDGQLWPLLAGADAALNPMVSGGGSNLKLFDYLAVGTPILATATGARGLDHPADFVTLVDPDIESLSTGLDLIAALAPEEIAARAIAGRNMVEAEFDWRVLGTRWSAALLDLVDGASPPVRPVASRVVKPILSTDDPPHHDSALAAMDLVAGLALTSPPPTNPDTIMNPIIRERLKEASANRHVGQVLPPDARYPLPKKALIRVGQALSNEQVVFNEATLDVMEQLAQQLDKLTASNETLRDRVAKLEDRTTLNPSEASAE